MIFFADLYCIITPQSNTQSLVNMNTPSQTTLTATELNIHMSDGGAGSIAREMVRAEGIGMVVDDDDYHSMRSDSGNSSMCSEWENGGESSDYAIHQNVENTEIEIAPTLSSAIAKLLSFFTVGW